MKNADGLVHRLRAASGVSPELATIQRHGMGDELTVLLPNLNGVINSPAIQLTILLSNGQCHFPTYRLFVVMRVKKAPEDWRSPKALRAYLSACIGRSFWTAPVLWRFFGVSGAPANSQFSDGYFPLFSI